MDEKCVKEINRAGMDCYGPSLIDPLYGLPYKLAKCYISQFDVLRCKMEKIREK